MKPTIIIISVIVSLLALLTAIEAVFNEPVLDYRTGTPIQRRDGCVLRALWNGQQFYVDKMDNSPYVGLTSGPRPSRFLRVKDFSDQSGKMRVNTKYSFKFTDSTGFWQSATNLYRIDETALSFNVADRYTFQETEEARVYKMMANPLANRRGDEIGIMVKNEANEDKYYLALIKEGFVPESPTEPVRLEHVRFTFEKP